MLQIFETKDRLRTLDFQDQLMKELFTLCALTLPDCQCSLLKKLAQPTSQKTVVDALSGRCSANYNIINIDGLLNWINRLSAWMLPRSKLWNYTTLPSKFH